MTIDDVKAQAKALRATLQAQETAIRRSPVCSFKRLGNAWGTRRP
ncbi:hypothetical protein C8N35_101107 [Breoghania corrubedonensis]|uniref:Uncharacterized protein n=1 Tax=Breoghania corrubedonensis TaxID=665038 RepID=A0A2T5VE83_9HYPH|nr:hypothetical protein [Breoghania corrubedonensis]PTW62072.1 hypothetical protein C8N35_101107 [Breoghania corrubedonensis]